MDENINIPYEELAESCGIINPDSPRKSAAAVSALAGRYSGAALAHIYNYFFERSNCYEVLMVLLDKIDKLKDASSRPILIDSLVMKEKLASRLSDSENISRIRSRIAKVLAGTKDPQAVNPLLYCLNNKNENYKVKLSCADALGRIGGSYAVLPLMRVVEDEDESSVYVKESAVSALGMIGDDKAVDSLVSILETKNSLMNKFTFLKERALEALNKLKFKGNRVIRALEKSLEDASPQVRINAVEVLMNSNDDRAPELIKKMLYDTDSEVVRNAVTALYNILDEYVLDEIIGSDNIPCTAKAAAKNLKEELRYDNDEGNEK